MLAWTVAKGKVAYWGLDGWVGVTFKVLSERKAGGEGPKTDGVKVFGGERWLFSVGAAELPPGDRAAAPDIENMGERDGLGWEGLLGACWKFIAGEMGGRLEVCLGARNWDCAFWRDSGL